SFIIPHTRRTSTYTLSLHDALPISRRTRASPYCRLIGEDLKLLDRWLARRLQVLRRDGPHRRACARLGGSYGCSRTGSFANDRRDRKSTRLNSSHQIISYAVFCLKK